MFGSTYGQYNGCWPNAPSVTTPTWEYKDRFLFNGMNTVNSSNINYKCVSYLLNTDLWTSIVDTNYADACIGGPTLEMMCASWNSKTPNEPLYFGVNSTGYTIGKSASNLDSCTVSITEYLGFSNTLYFPHNKPGSTSAWNSCYGYFLLATCAGDPNGICALDGCAIIRNANFNSHFYGIRPVVCLKSSVNMTKDANGIWQLSVD